MGLPKFEGKVVAESSMRLTNAGDGLSKEMKIAPRALKIGARVAFIGTGVVAHVDHRPVSKQSDLLDRQHTVRAELVTIVDPADVEGPLAAAQERIDAAEEAERLAAEREAGIQRLPAE